MAELIVALDVETGRKAVNLSHSLGDSITWYKVGAVLFTREGPSLVDELKKHGRKVMLDLKYHDIPNTVEQACKQAVTMGVDMLTIHLSGGRDMIKAAMVGADNKATVLGVSVLTSHNQESLDEVGFAPGRSVKGHVANLVGLGKLATDGKIGVVCSALETDLVRSILPNSTIVNPGIRLPSGDVNDQKRVSGPKEAIKAGANFLVIGRPIYAAKDPVAAAHAFREAM